MPAFEYWATTEIGDAVTGKITASSPDAASHLLTLRGLTVQRLEELAEETRPIAEPSPLSEDDFLAVSSQLELIARKKKPLVTSFRAMAEEIHRPKLKSAILKVVSQLEQGQPLDIAVQQLRPVLPQRMATLFEAAKKTDQLPFLMEQSLDHFRSLQTIRRQIWLKLTYPLILVLVCILMIGTIMIGLVPMFKKIFDDFGSDLPALTKTIIRASDTMVDFFPLAFVLAACLLFVGLVYALIRFTAGQRAIHEILNHLPLLGMLRQSIAFSGFFRMLSILMESGFALPEAFQLTAAMSNDASLAAHTDQVVKDLQQGVSPLDAARATEAFPREVLPVFRWTHKPKLFTQALRGAADIFAARAQMNSRVFIMIVEPIIILLIGSVLGMTVIALFMPLIQLLNDLS